MSDTIDIEYVTSRVIALARANYNGSSNKAAFDYLIHCGADRGEAELHNAASILANEGKPKTTAEERDRRAEELWQMLQPALDTYRQRCRQRRFVGWSSQAPGPIRYAD